jgi:hypothetical protein
LRRLRDGGARLRRRGKQRHDVGSETFCVGPTPLAEFLQALGHFDPVLRRQEFDVVARFDAAQLHQSPRRFALIAFISDIWNSGRGRTL